MSAPVLAPKAASAWYANYAPLPGIPDEFIGRDGKPRSSWRNFLELIDSDDNERSLAAAARRIRDIGVSYRVHGEAGERAWPMSRLPLLIEEGDWKEIVAGVAQRASSLRRCLRMFTAPAVLSPTAFCRRLLSLEAGTIFVRSST